MYFKSYVKAETSTAYADGAMHHNCPVRIADHERKLLWEDVSEWPADMFLSLGTGLSRSEADFSTGQHSSKPQRPMSRKVARHRSVAGISYLWRTASNIIDDQLNCEKIWDDYYVVSTPPGKLNCAEDRRRNMRLNMMFPEDRPSLDDVASLETIEHVAKEQLPLDSDIIEVAHRLVASCFYFEKFECRSPKGNERYQCFGKYQGPTTRVVLTINRKHTLSSTRRWQ